MPIPPGYFSTLHPRAPAAAKSSSCPKVTPSTDSPGTTGRCSAGIPQGRFAEAAALLDGAVLEITDAWGKHLFHRYSGGWWLHVHLGLYGKFSEGPLPAPEPRGALGPDPLRADADAARADDRAARNLFWCPHCQPNRS